jgi:hypothetical protein
MIVCPKAEREAGGFELLHHTWNDITSHYNAIAGHVAHFGQSLDQANVLSWDPGITGPYNHEIRGGWYVWYSLGAPKEVVISGVQVNSAKPSIMLAMSYPVETTFTIRANALANSCNPSTRLCEHHYTEVSSVDAVRAANGDTYHFDGEYLYLKIVPNSAFKLGQNSLEWAPVERDPFTRDGLSIPDRTQNKYTIQISADCATAVTDEGNEYCGVTPSVPALCPDGWHATGIDACEQDTASVVDGECNEALCLWDALKTNLQRLV